MQTEVLVALIIASVALLSALVTAILSFRASPYGELAERVVELEKEVKALKAHDRAHAVVLQTHAEWDARALATIPADSAVTLGPPPPLYPPDTPGG